MCKRVFAVIIMLGSFSPLQHVEAKPGPLHQCRQECSAEKCEKNLAVAVKCISLCAGTHETIAKQIYIKCYQALSPLSKEQTVEESP